jgi:hypothetical protein
VKVWDTTSVTGILLHETLHRSKLRGYVTASNGTFMKYQLHHADRP